MVGPPIDYPVDGSKTGVYGVCDADELRRVNGNVPELITFSMSCVWCFVARRYYLFLS